MGRITGTALGCGIAAMMVGTIWAQAQESQQVPPNRVQLELRQRDRAATQQAGAQHACLATKVIGTAVMAQQEEFGTIANLVIDSNGQVQYLVVRTGAQEGDAARAQAPDQAGELTLIPFELAQIPAASGETQQAEKQHITLQIEKERLAQAPKFTEQQLMQGQGEWMAQVDQFFGRQRRGVARPELERRPGEQPRQRQQQRNPGQEREESQQQRDN